MPASLNCPTCGAPAAGPEASQCDYCGSTLTTVGCPKCFGAMFAGMLHCPHCGAKSTRVVDENATLACPGCKGTMQSVTVGHTSLFECTKCSSTWLDAETFTKLCLDREEHGAIAAMLGSEKAAPLKASVGAVTYRPCPVCARMMNRQNFGRKSGVIIDVCKGHGTWFEARELQTCMAFIDSGGLEKARAAEGEQRRLAQRAEDARRANAMPQGGGGHSPMVTQSSDKPSIGESFLREALNMLFS